MASGASKLRFLLQEVESERLVMTMPSNSTTSSLQRWDASAAQQQQQQQQRQQQLSHAQALEMARAHARSHEVKAPLDVEERLCENIPGLGVFLFRKDAQHNKRPQDFTQLNSVQKNAIVKIAYSIIEQVCGRICPGQEADLLDSISRIHQTYYRHRAVTLKNAAATAALHQMNQQQSRAPAPPPGSWLGDGAYEMKEKGSQIGGLGGMGGPMQALRAPPSIGSLRAAAELMEGYPPKASDPSGMGGPSYGYGQEQVGAARRPPPPPESDMQRAYKRRQAEHQVHMLGTRPVQAPQTYGPGRSYMASPQAPAHSMAQSMGGSLSLPSPAAAPTPQEALILNKLWQARDQASNGGRSSALLAAASLLNDAPSQQPSHAHQTEPALARPPIVTVEI